MFKALRKIKEKSEVSGEDATDKKRIKDVEEAVLTVQRTLSYYYKTFLDHNANSFALHEDLANLYPANAKLSASIAALNTSGQVFKDAAAMVEEMKALIEPPLAKLFDRTKALSDAAEERQILRAEIAHYREKVTKLANEGLADAGKQNKAESNQQKLFANQRRFQELDHIVNTGLASIDIEIAEVIEKPLAAFLQIHANYSSALLGVYGNAMSAMGAITAIPNAAADAASPEVPSASLNSFLGSENAQSPTEPSTSESNEDSSQQPPKSTAENPFD
jgi:hypothetical protein